MQGSETWRRTKLLGLSRLTTQWVVSRLKISNFGGERERKSRVDSIFRESNHQYESPTQFFGRNSIKNHDFLPILPRKRTFDKLYKLVFFLFSLQTPFKSIQNSCIYFNFRFFWWYLGPFTCYFVGHLSRLMSRINSNLKSEMSRRLMTHKNRESWQP